MKYRKHIVILIFSLTAIAEVLAMMVFWHSISTPLFDDPASIVISDAKGNLLGARIAKDEQWRFPENMDIPAKFTLAVSTFEDKRFYRHPGIDPVAFARAAYQNISQGRIVSGGSTLTMQLVRLMRKNRPRTIGEKIIEMILAIRIELSYSKDEILGLYASHAPFGGNIVGLDAAAWRYYHRSPQSLSWAEAATLAVLPNAPSLIHPGRNRELLLSKRNHLLNKLYEDHEIDSLTYAMSMLEPLPEQPWPLPMDAPHLLSRIAMEKDGENVRTTIDLSLQQQVCNILARHHIFWADNHVFNAAVLVAEVETGNVLAYHGNAPVKGPDEHAYDVDIITASRSSGSILKPFLYASMNEAGEILPGMLVPDIPVQMEGFSPKNYSLEYDGAVPAERALSRSLNIPAVFMLKEHGFARFHHKLRQLGFSTINRPSVDYGLSLILGGAEVTLWDLASIYSSLSRVLRNYEFSYAPYRQGDFRQLNFYADNVCDRHQARMKNSLLSASAIWLTYNAMINVNRPGSIHNWKAFSSMGKIAWKTGTSFGFRDAWAVGTTRDYVVAVWVGNADGEGRPGLTGIGAAAPIMFDVFALLPSAPWFDIPENEMEKVAICRQSGHRAGQYCTDTVYQWICEAGLQSPPCPYHKLVNLDSSGNYRLNTDCAATDQIYPTPWFSLSPVQEWYYVQNNPGYRILPPFRDDCRPQDGRMMDFIYPGLSAKVFVPRELDGEEGRVVFKLAHSLPEARVYWHLDEKYLATTSGGIHQLGLSPGKGHHVITAIDNLGNKVSRQIEVVN